MFSFRLPSSASYQTATLLYIYTCFINHSWVVAIFHLSAMLSAPFAGAFADRFGRRTAIVGGGFLFIAGAMIQVRYDKCVLRVRFFVILIIPFPFVYLLSLSSSSSSRSTSSSLPFLSVYVFSYSPLLPSPSHTITFLSHSQYYTNTPTKGVRRPRKHCRLRLYHDAHRESHRWFWKWLRMLHRPCLRLGAGSSQVAGMDCDTLPIHGDSRNLVVPHH